MLPDSLLTEGISFVTTRSRPLVQFALMCVGALQARISEELRDERFFLWDHLSWETVERIGQVAYADMWQKYRIGAKRARKKRGTTHIIWAAAPGGEAKPALPQASPRPRMLA